jgi:hypothetical protein
MSVDSLFSYPYIGGLKWYEEKRRGIVRDKRIQREDGKDYDSGGSQERPARLYGKGRLERR